MPAGFIDVRMFGQYYRGFAASGDLRVEDDLRVVSVIWAKSMLAARCKADIPRFCDCSRPRCWNRFVTISL